MFGGENQVSGLEIEAHLSSGWYTAFLLGLLFMIILMCVRSNRNGKVKPSTPFYYLTHFTTTRSRWIKTIKSLKVDGEIWSFSACPGADKHGNWSRDDIVHKGGSGSFCSDTAGTSGYGRTYLGLRNNRRQLQQCHSGNLLSIRRRCENQFMVIRCNQISSNHHPSDSDRHWCRSAAGCNGRWTSDHRGSAAFGRNRWFAGHSVSGFRSSFGCAARRSCARARSTLLGRGGWVVGSRRCPCRCWQRWGCACGGHFGSRDRGDRTGDSSGATCTGGRTGQSVACAVATGARCGVRRSRAGCSSTMNSQRTWRAGDGWSDQTCAAWCQGAGATGAASHDGCSATSGGACRGRSRGSPSRHPGEGGAPSCRSSAGCPLPGDGIIWNPLQWWFDEW